MASINELMNCPRLEMSLKPACMYLYLQMQLLLLPVTLSVSTHCIGISSL